MQETEMVQSYEYITTPMDPAYDTSRSEFRVTDTNIVYHVPRQPGQGPDCIWDGSQTQRAGSCYICPACGESTGCG